jgi:hypothetical protein
MAGAELEDLLHGEVATDKFSQTTSKHLEIAFLGLLTEVGIDECIKELHALDSSTISERLPVQIRLYASPDIWGENMQGNVQGFCGRKRA